MIINVTFSLSPVDRKEKCNVSGVYSHIYMIMTRWISPDGSVVVLLCFEKRLHELQFGQQR